MTNIPDAQLHRVIYFVMSKALDSIINHFTEHRMINTRGYIDKIFTNIINRNVALVLLVEIHLHYISRYVKTKYKIEICINKIANFTIIIFCCS